MDKENNIEIVKSTYARFKSGDIEGLSSLYSNDISWELPVVEGTPFGGKLRGLEAVEDFFEVLGEHEDHLTFETT